jgi:O-antigen/teichoic acid export membrane protein
VAFAGLIATRRPGGFKRPRFAAVRHALAFSWQVLVAQLSWNFYTDADFLVAGRVLGANPLGAYTLGWNLATVPVEKITTLVGQVTPAVFSASQTDVAGLRRYVLGLTEGLSVITFPMAMGLMITAPDLVPVLFGKNWLATVAPLQALAFFASARSISALLGPLLIVLRETRFIMWTNVAAAVLMPTAFYIGSHWGPAGIAWGWVAAYPAIMLCLYRRAFLKVGMPRGAYLRILLPAFSGTAGMLAGLWLLNRFLAAGWSPPLRLCADIVGGAAIYCAILALLYPDRIRALINLYRGLRPPSAVAV